jgi:uncharacterized membrane protein
MVENKGISIWFFIGSLLLIYGIIITLSNIAEVMFGAFGRKVVLGNLHFGIWWGILLIIVGLVYFISFRPWKKKGAIS